MEVGDNVPTHTHRGNSCASESLVMAAANTLSFNAARAAVANVNGYLAFYYPIELGHNYPLMERRVKGDLVWFAA